MSQMFGADSHGLRQLASKLDQLATRLVAVESAATNRVETMAWIGPDAEKFKARWRGGSSVAMRSASSDLAEAATAIRGDAQRQDQASGSI